MQSWDFIVVGGGTAGCAVANQLSQEGHRILLIEAGIDTAPGQVPEDIRDTFPASYSNPDYTWGSTPSLTTLSDGNTKPTPFFQAKVMGGGSSLMGMVALRGYPDDYDHWARMGATDWSWSDVRPEFMALEDDAWPNHPDHSMGGPIHIMRRGPEVWPPFCHALAQSMESRGLSHVSDMNTDFRDGYCTYPLSSTPNERVSSASAFLNSDVRSQLQVMACTEVLKLRWEKDRCIGVQVKQGLDAQNLSAGGVIVCAGGIHTPALLMRSGVGDAPMLESMGVNVTNHVPAVGRNLQNHCIAYLGTYLQPHARQNPNLRPHFHMGLRLSSPLSPANTGDIAVTVLPKSSLKGLGHAIGALGVALYQPKGVGEVRIDQLGYPIPRFSYIELAEDFDRLCWGYSQAWDLMQHPAISKIRAEIFAAGYSEKVRQLNRPGLLNTALSSALITGLDFSNWSRKWTLKHLITAGESANKNTGSEQWIKNTVQRMHFGMYHPTGTCRMGQTQDLETVVSPKGQVKGTQGLWIADASVMPQIPRANTFLPTLMVARKIAKTITLMAS